MINALNDLSPDHGMGMASWLHAGNAYQFVHDPSSERPSATHLDLWHQVALKASAQPIYPHPHPPAPQGSLTLSTVFQNTEWLFRKGEVFCLVCAFALPGAGRGF